jgi:alpha-tubulin suppressor-like RCC1 family protein
MPNPNTNFKRSDGVDLGNILITKEYLMSVYPQIANQLITPELWIWGNNDIGSLGINGTTSRSTPVTTFSGGTNWKQVAGGRDHTAAIKTDGTLWIWGRNNFASLGINNGDSKLTPVTTFAGGTNWKQVACGDFYTTAIKTDGTLWIWGRNNNGQLGINNTADRSTPVTTFLGGTNWKFVNCGREFTSAIKTDGTLWNWGRNAYGQLGISDTANRNTPVTTFAGGTNWKSVACGEVHTAAIKTDGTLWVWGRNSYGQLGININTTVNRITPVTTFAGGTNWKSVACQFRNMAAIKTDGTLWTWGANNVGQLGINNSDDKITPVTTFSGGTNWKQVDCGGNSTAAIKTDGTLWGWGFNNFAELGINDTTTRSTPVTTFLGGTNWKSVAYGFIHVAAIQSVDYI